MSSLIDPMKFYNHIFRMRQNGVRNAHFESASARVYVRLSKRTIDGRPLTPTLDIGDVNVEEMHRGAGVFRTLLGEAELFCENDRMIKTVFIENVLEERLVGFFGRRGYSTVCTLEPLNTPCFYRKFG